MSEFVVLNVERLLALARSHLNSLNHRQMDVLYMYCRCALLLHMPFLGLNCICFRQKAMVNQNMSLSRPLFSQKQKVLSLTRLQFVKKSPKCNGNLDTNLLKVLYRNHPDKLLLLPANNESRDFSSVVCIPNLFYHVFVLRRFWFKRL